MGQPVSHAQATYRLALERNLQEPGRMAVLAAMVQLSKAPTTAILQQVRIPALLVMGPQDPDFDDPVGEAKWIAGETGGQVRIIPGAGHYPHVEMPDQVGPVVVGFMRSLNP